jgi:hypothetical protein
MKSVSFKLGIIAVLIVLSRCGDDSPISTLHPLLILKEERVAIVKEERVDTISRVMMTTTAAAKDYSMYRIISDSCIVSYPWVLNNEDGSPTPIVAIVKIANDSTSSQSAIFHGMWEFPDSLFQFGPLTIRACLSDESNHDVCASLVVRGSTPLP